MKNTVALLLRIALGIGFLSAVADRFGYWGPPGEAGVVWGDWGNFIKYTGELNFGVSGIVANALGAIATLLEVVLGILLLIGLKIKYTAFLSGILLLLFALEMSINSHLKSPLDGSVFVASFAAFLLAMQPVNKWSIDSLLKKNKFLLPIKEKE